MKKDKQLKKELETLRAKLAVLIALKVIKKP